MVDSSAIIVLEIFQTLTCLGMLYGLAVETKIKNKQKTFFIHMIVSYIIILVLDVPYMIMLESDNRFWENTLFIIPLMLCSWTDYLFVKYIEAIAETRGIKSSRFLNVTKGYLLLVVAAIAVLFVTGNLIDYQDGETVYFGGYDIYLSMLVIGYVLILLFLLKYAKKFGTSASILMLFVFLPFIADCLEAYNDELAFTYPTTVLAFLLIYIRYQSHLNNETEKEKMELFTSIANTYYTMHIFDLEDNSMTEFGAADVIKSYHNDNMSLPMQELIWGVMKQRISSKHYNAIKDFTDLSTMDERMRNLKSIDIELLNVDREWMRFSLIRIGESKTLKKVFFTCQNINESKRREKELLMLSHSDELTRVYNRNAFEEFVKETNEDGVPTDLWYISVDLNGLKVANDTYGHDAGDELLINMAECLKLAVSIYGNVYRVGGDEFIVIMKGTEKDANQVLDNLKSYMENYNKGKKIMLSCSIGLASAESTPNASFTELGKLADKRMYEDKIRYYKEKGVNREGIKI